MNLSIANGFRFKQRWIPLLVWALWFGMRTCAPTQAQPADSPSAPSTLVTEEIRATVAALIEATQSDEGYGAAQRVVVGAAPDAQLKEAWREWRRASLTREAPTSLSFTSPKAAPTLPDSSSPDPGTTRLLLQEVEVEEFRPARGPGGALTGAASALVRVHLDLATQRPNLPAAEWPAQPWQGEFTLQKSEAPGASWQFAAFLRNAPFGDVPGDVPGAETLIELPERGGNPLEQAIRVARDPEAMLRTASVLADTRSLQRLVAAVQRYTARAGHYPPADYAAALLEREPLRLQSALRRAFEVEGTPRFWILNPALAGTEVRQATAQQATAQRQPGAAPLTDAPLFWDGNAQGPVFRLAGQTLLAFVDGRVELRRAPDSREARTEEAPLPGATPFPEAPSQKE